PFKRAFSPGVLRYLEELLQTSIPAPEFFSRSQRANQSFLPDEVLSSSRFREGAAKAVFVNAYERSSEARQECIRKYGMRCFVCNMSFEERYGPEMNGFIHVHHLRPISSQGKEYRVNPTRDLRP